jgi:hypothetical protein
MNETDTYTLYGVVNNTFQVDMRDSLDTSPERMKHLNVAVALDIMLVSAWPWQNNLMLLLEAAVGHVERVE